MTFLAAACSKTLDQPPVETKEAPVTIRTQANGGNDTNQLNASETAVKSVRIYISTAANWIGCNTSTHRTAAYN